MEAFMQAPKYHFNKKSAAAFGTRLYLLMKQYDKVLEYANQLISIPSQFETLTDSKENLLKIKMVHRNNISQKMILHFRL